MKRWQAIFIVLLLTAPVVAFVAVGSWALWQTGQLLWMWVLLPVSWGIALLLAKLWGTRVLPLKAPPTDPPLHWTPRDREAWKRVEERVRRADQTPPRRLTELQFYVDTARDLAIELTRCYHPEAHDPAGALTLPEILAAAELAFEDLARTVDAYVPGSHLLTVNHWRTLARLPGLSRTVSKLYWPISALFSPTTVAGRYAAARMLTEPAARTIQANILAWFYAAFVQRVGYYII
ncbi:MAG: hypothetical protein KY476_24420, partial [Planctomycetes bacterium]|nr:hypothetical protein [Planctomycetota bacterium]